MVNFSTISSMILSLFMTEAEPVKQSDVTADPIIYKVNEAVEAKESVLIDDFTSEIYSWWVNSPDIYETKWDRDGEVLHIKAIKPGAPGPNNKYDTFGKQIHDPIDFSVTPVLKFDLKYAGNENPPKIRVDLKDYDGKVANGKPLVKTMKAGDGFNTYYYDFTGHWVQSWPEEDVVDPVEIIEVLFYVNPGGPEWKGDIYMDNISAISLDDVPADAK